MSIGPIRHERGKLCEPYSPYKMSQNLTGSGGALLDITAKIVRNRLNSPEKLLKQTLLSESPDLFQIRDLIGDIQDKGLIIKTYNQLLRGVTGHSTVVRAQLLQIFLRDGDLLESDVKKIFTLNDHRLLEAMDKQFLINLYISCNTPVDSILFIAILKNEPLEDLFAYCFKHNLRSSLLMLSIKMSESSLVHFIKKQLYCRRPETLIFVSARQRQIEAQRSERRSPFPEGKGEEEDRFGEVAASQKSKFQADGSINAGVTPKVLKALAGIVPFARAPQANLLISSYFLNLSESELRNKEVIAFGESFFFHEFIDEQVALETADAPLLQAAFRFYWSMRDLLTGGQILKMITIAESIFIKDPGYISCFISDFFEAAPEEEKFPFLLGRILHCLDQKTLDLIDEKMKRIGPSNLQPFIRASIRKSLMVWKYEYGEVLRNIPVITKGSQIGKDGPIDVQKAKSIIQKLNETAPKSVQFDSTKLQPRLDGGVCSAMTLNLLSLYWLNRTKYGGAKETLKNIGSAITLANEEFRTVQAAYNTIGKTEAITQDFKGDKIEALLKFDNPSLKIVYSSEEIDLAMDDSRQKITSQLLSLPDGVFVFRSLNFFDETFDDFEVKVKGESYGHSTLLIKEKGDMFYYDPAIGILQLTHAEQLDMVLKWEHARWTLPSVRIYQVS